ncbi:MAG: endolytic transglycosylase MltG [Dysgonamonadaceae bacterium]|jgi:UPF0755 protein|nr:endolytic transglycosylase MltG [Dysgonamonadaceae bacterium]
MKKQKKIVLGTLASAILLIVALGGFVYYKLTSPFFNIQETVYIYIDDRKDYPDLLLQLQSTAKIKDTGTFRKLANALNYPQKMRTGRYAVTPNLSCKDLLLNLTRGNQTPCKITFNNIRLKNELAENIGIQLMFGTAALQQKLNDPSVCAKYGFDEQTIQCLFIPDTYEMYWNISPERFLERMKKEYDHFWTPERLEKAAEIPLSPVQVSVLASIVEEETVMPDEYPQVAGLYINRLKKGMLLQADPTVKYAVGDFALKRILYTHLEVESPYNTYKHEGLPPGPIRVPSIRGLDAVLNYTHHHYLYMCAKEDFSGRHNFATTLAEHARNARRYQAALNRNNIR